MPKYYKRLCEWCGEYYEGAGARFCGLECAGKARSAEFQQPDPPDDDAIDRVSVEERDDGTATVTCEGSYRNITSIEDLIDAAPLDLDKWEIDRHVVNKWETAAKGPDGELVSRELWQVKAWLRLKITADNLVPAPTRIEVPYVRRTKYRPDDGAVSVHFADEHFPYHDPRAINLLYQVLEILGPGRVVAHGDVIDCTEISKYEKDPTNRTSLSDELALGATHLATVTALAHPDARRMYLLGNHEDRVRRMIWKLADDRAAGELVTLPDVQDALALENLMGLDGWQVVPYPEHRLLHDRLIVKHGSVVRKHAGQTARAEYEMYGKSGMSGHSHRRGSYERRDHNGQHTWFELGMLGAIRADYAAFPNWQQGFCVVRWSDDGEHFGVERVRIHDGVAYFRGDRFVGDSELFGDLAAA